MQEKAVQKKCDKIEDIELRIDEGSAKKCKRSSARRIWREEEAAVREDLLRLILRAPSEPVVLVRDRDRVYGDCLPKSPQPATRT